MKEFIADLLFRSDWVGGFLAWLTVITGLWALWTLTRLFYL